jgi:hypothetical protein
MFGVLCNIAIWDRNSYSYVQEKFCDKGEIIDQRKLPKDKKYGRAY